MYVCMHVCMYVCMYVCVYACMRVCVYACMRVFVHACMHIMRIHTKSGGVSMIRPPVPTDNAPISISPVIVCLMYEFLFRVQSLGFSQPETRNPNLSTLNPIPSIF